MTRTYSILALLVVCFGSAGCSKSDGPDTESGADAATRGLECDHDIRTSSVLRSTWPYPADFRNLKWIGPSSRRIQLKLKPVHAAFVTATVGWPNGSFLEVQDSQVRILKPRRLVAKRDLVVTSEEIEQGVKVRKTYPAVKKGEVGSFYFYNSRGLCLIGFDEGVGWTECTLDDAFEGLSAENPHPCAQEWWVQLIRRKVDRGWAIVDPELMARVVASEAE